MRSRLQENEGGRQFGVAPATPTEFCTLTERLPARGNTGLSNHYITQVGMFLSKIPTPLTEMGALVLIVPPTETFIG
jgi:hypothetical protein